jgi:CspA family cold shock protein
MATGTVKFFNETKGFGFIKSDNGGEVFVHITGITSGNLSENDKVEFEVEEGRKGPTAVKVRKID